MALMLGLFENKILWNITKLKKLKLEMENQKQTKKKAASVNWLYNII